MKHMSLVILIMVMLVGATVSVQAEYFDFGGATISILSNPGAFVGQPGVTPGPQLGRHLEAEELFNCKIEFLGGVGWYDIIPRMMTRLLSGDSEYDIWPTNSFLFWSLVAQGALYPLDDVLSDEYLDSLPAPLRAVSDYMSFRGSRYGFGANQAIGGTLSVVYLADVFERLGLPDPQELYLTDEWTWDAMAEIARLATADTSGDGQTDRWGVTGLARTHVALPFVYTNDRAALVTEIDGRMVFTGSEQKFIDAVNTVVEWMNEGFAFPHNVHPQYPPLTTGEAAMVVTALSQPGSMTLAGNAPEAPYRIVPLPRWSSESEQLFPSDHLSTFVLPANSRYPEGMVQLVDFLWSTEDYEDRLELNMHTWARDRTTSRLMWEIHDNFTGYAAMLSQSWDGLAPAYAALESAFRGDTPIATGMAEIAEAMQTMLDELFNE